MLMASCGDRVTINTKDDDNGGNGGCNGVVPDDTVKKPKIDSDPSVTMKTEKSFTTGGCTGAVGRARKRSGTQSKSMNCVVFRRSHHSC